MSCRGGRSQEYLRQKLGSKLLFSSDTPMSNSNGSVCPTPGNSKLGNPHRTSWSRYQEWNQSAQQFPHSVEYRNIESNEQGLLNLVAKVVWLAYVTVMAQLTFGSVYLDYASLKMYQSHPRPLKNSSNVLGQSETHTTVSILLRTLREHSLSCVNILCSI